MVFSPSDKLVDMEPQKDHIIIKIQKNRKEPVIVNEIALEKDITDIKKTIQNCKRKS